MKRGDLIQFRLNFPHSNTRERPWSDPALVMYQEDPEGYPAEEVDDGLWIVFMTLLCGYIIRFLILISKN